MRTSWLPNPTTTFSPTHALARSRMLFDPNDYSDLRPFVSQGKGHRSRDELVLRIRKTSRRMRSAPPGGEERCFTVSDKQLRYLLIDSRNEVSSRSFPCGNPHRLQGFVRTHH